MRQFSTAFLILLLSGCGLGYQELDGKVAYVTWDEGNGRRVYYIENADAESLEVISEDRYAYAKDKSRVYLRDREVWGADPETFTLLESPYAKDGRHIYCGTVPIEPTSLEDFEILDNPYPGASSHDSVNDEDVIADFGKISTVPAGVEVTIGRGWARDAAYCYYGPTRLEEADPLSFECLDPYYAKDAHNVYYKANRIEGAHAESFRSTRNGYGFDTLRSYHYGKPEEGS